VAKKRDGQPLLNDQRTMTFLVFIKLLQCIDFLL